MFEDDDRVNAVDDGALESETPNKPEWQDTNREIVR